MLSSLGLTLALLSSLCWAGLDATRKRLVATVPSIPAVFLLTLGQLPLFAMWIIWEGRFDIALENYWPYGLASVGLNIVANIAFIRALELSPLSKTIPFLSLTPVMVAVVAWFALDEALSVPQIAGVILVVVGAAGLGFWDSKSDEAAGAARIEPGSVLMILVAALWSIASAVDKLALQHAPVPSHAFFQLSGVCIGLFVLVLARRELGELTRVRRALSSYLGALLFFAAALSFQLLAIELVLVGIVETIKRTVGATMSIIIGRLVFDEPVNHEKIISILLMIIGTALLLLGPRAAG